VYFELLTGKELEMLMEVSGTIEGLVCSCRLLQPAHNKGS